MRIFEDIEEYYEYKLRDIVLNRLTNQDDSSVHSLGTLARILVEVYLYQNKSYIVHCCA